MAGKNTREEGQGAAYNLLGSLAGPLNSITCPSCAHVFDPPNPTPDEAARAAGRVNQSDDSEQGRRMRARAATNNAFGGMRGTTK